MRRTARPFCCGHHAPALLLGLLLAASSGAQAPASSGAQAPAQEAADPGFEIERFERFVALGESRRVVVDNAFGDIRARFGGYGQEVEVRAVLQHFAAEGPRLEVDSAHTEQGLVLAVGYRDGGSFVTAARPDWKKRADLVVFVPDTVAFASHAAAGLTELKGLRSDVEARSAGGDIVARKIRGELDLASDSGHVLAVPMLRRSSETQRLRSGGELTIYLFDEADVALEARSRGLVSTDFSITMTGSNDWKELGLELGKGTMAITAEAGEHLRLVRKPSADRARPRRGDEKKPPAAAAEPAGTGPGSRPGPGSGPESGEPERRNAEAQGDLQLRAVAGEAQSVTTLTGDITLLVPDGSYAIELATSGEITVDFPVEIEYRYHGEPSKVGLITIGSGATPIRLESRRGAIRILRAP